MLTADEVRKALDLVPFEGFARKRSQENDKKTSDATILPGVALEYAFRGRLTGRSTRMLCSLLASVSSGRRCAIYASPQVVEDTLKDRARGWAEKLGLNSKLIVGHLATADVEFFDHSWYELL